MRSDSSGAPSASNLIIEMLEIRCPIIKRKRLSHPNSFKRSLELNPRQKNFNCLVLTLVLVPTITDPTAKEQCCKRGAVGAKDAGGINIILAFLNGFFSSLQVRDNWLQLGRVNPYRILSLLKIFFGILGKSQSFFLRISKLV